MRKSKSILLGVMTLMFCLIVGTTNACVQFTNHDTYTVDESGCVEY